MLPAQLPEWNSTDAGYPRASTVADAFAAQAARTPDTVAVIARGRSLTYQELDERSNRLAHRLLALGVVPDTLVGVAVERTEMLVVSLLGVLKAGAAYVPLDLSYPQDRLALVMEDAQMAALVTTAASRDRLPLSATGLTILDAEDANLAHENAEPVASAATAHNIAYVIYTSGSTGKPKGVMVENRNVVNFFTGMDRAIGCTPGVWLAVTSASFDISVLELLWTLTRGFTVVVHGDEGAATIADEIARYGVTHLQMTPSLARVLTLDRRAYSALGSLRQILLGGEAVPAALVGHLRQVFKGEIYNMYGPTETTVWSTAWSTVWSTACRVEEAGSTVSIGRPIANTQIYLLDSNLQPVPIGEIGELFIGGDGVARGYWRRPELTAERFLTIPALAPDRGDFGKIYRTGDLARYRPDGNIDFLGRADDQIKLRGHRIEPGEIEALLEKCTGVRQAVVVLREDHEGDKRLVAYLVAEQDAKQTGALKGQGFSRAVETPNESFGVLDGTAEALPFQNSCDVATLRAVLAAKLPDYMVPSAFVFLDELPLTANGKIDRKALLKLPSPHRASAAPTAEPATEMERTVARAWQQALGIPSVGLKDNFFDLGAHSLTVAEAHAKLQESLGREIPLVDLFQFTTVSALAAHLDAQSSDRHTAANQLSERAARRRMARQREAVSS